MSSRARWCTRSGNGSCKGTVPAKTPKEVIDKVSLEVAKALAQPKVKEVFATSAAEPGAMTPAQLKQYLANEVKAWGEVVRSVGLKID